MGQLCAPRKRRKHPVITEMAGSFADAIREGNLEKAAKIALLTVLKMGGVEGIKRAMDRANSFLRRKDMRRGLE